MDFVVELPESVGFDMVMIVVSSVSKRICFILTYTIVTIENTTQIFLHYIWKLHDLSMYILFNIEL